MMSQYAAAKGVAAPDAAVATSGAMLVAGGATVMTGSTRARVWTASGSLLVIRSRSARAA